MFDTFNETSPILTLLTLVVCFFLVYKSKRDLFSSIDGIFATLGLAFGIFMTFMNLIYTSNRLFLIAPTIAIGCSAYIRYREALSKSDLAHIFDNFDASHFPRCLDILYWVSIFCLIVILHTAEPYNRPLPFFVITALGVTFVGLDIILSTNKGWIKRNYLILKVLLLSFVLRCSAYFISGYPVGSDPWVHSQYIYYFTENGRLIVPGGFMSYYVSYPISHLLAVISGFITNLGIKESWFIIGVALIVGSIFVYLIVRFVTGDEHIALLSLLLLNFFDSHIQWSAQIIAMSLGIVLYSFILYLFFKSIYWKAAHRYVSSSILFLLMFLIIWTHTVSSFIMLVTLVTILLSTFIYRILYEKKDIQIPLSFLVITGIFFCTLLLTKWFDPQYMFSKSVTLRLIDSVSTEASFLGKLSFSNITGNWLELYNVLGLIMYVFFGITGAFYCTSKKRITWPVFSLFVVGVVLFFICYAFPVMGMQNIVPDRWPAFAIVSFVLFVSAGFLSFQSLIVSKFRKVVFISLILLLMSFFMMTNIASNMDSPPLGTATFEKLIWSDSQMALFENVVSTYEGVVATDSQTRVRPFGIYLGVNNVVPFKVTPDGTFDMECLRDKLIVWREESLTLPVGVDDGSYVTQLYLGQSFYESLDALHNCIMNSGGSRAYL